MTGRRWLETVPRRDQPEGAEPVSGGGAVLVVVVQVLRQHRLEVSGAKTSTLPTTRSHERPRHLTSRQAPDCRVSRVRSTDHRVVDRRVIACVRARPTSGNDRCWNRRASAVVEVEE